MTAPTLSRTCLRRTVTGCKCEETRAAGSNDFQFQRSLLDAGSDQTMSMKSVRFLSRKLPQLSLAIVGLSFLLASCANTNQKSANIGSPFPQDYNSDARAFEGAWPYGHAGFK